jgi:hypothetical protein
MCIAAASAGDTIVLAAGTYTESVTLNRSVSLVGAGMTNTILAAPVNQRALVTSSPDAAAYEIRNLSLRGSGSVNGNGAVLVITGTTGAMPMLRDIVVYSGTSSGGYGGGIFNNRNEPLQIERSVVRQNSAYNGAGGIYSPGGLMMTSTLVMSNTSAQGVGGVDSGINYGGPISAIKRTNRMISSTIRGNSVGIFGDSGGASLYGTIYVDASVFSENSGRSGAGGLSAYASDAIVTITRSRFEDNLAYESRGGGASVVGRDVFVEDNRFTKNTADFGGGGLYVGGINVTVSRNGFVENRLYQYTTVGSDQRGGGGLYVINTPNATLQQNHFEGNRDGGAGYKGGALLIAGYSQFDQIQIFNSHFYLNYALQQVGSDVALVYSSLTQPTISVAHTSHTNFSGDNAIYGSGVRLAITNTLFYGPRYAISMTNSSLVDSRLLYYSPNAGGITLAMGVTPSGVNFNQDPNWNSSTGWIFAGSPAINQGVVVAGVTTDYEGDPRPVGGAPDIGADEYAPSRLYGVVFEDLNNDLAWNADFEPLVPSATVRVLQNGATVAQASSALLRNPTLFSNYHIGSVPVGANTFTITLPAGYVSSGPRPNASQSGADFAKVDWPLRKAAPAPLPQATIEDASAAESEGALRFRVSISPALVSAIAVTLTATSGTAQAGADFDATERMFMVPAGSQQIELALPIVADGQLEPEEYLTVTLSSAPGVLQIMRTQARGVILGESGAPTATLTPSPTPTSGAVLTPTVTPVVPMTPTSPMNKRVMLPQVVR